MRYLSLAEELVIAEAVTGIDARALSRAAHVAVGEWLGAARRADAAC